VIVRGVVSAPAFHFSAYSTLAIQDDHNGGVLKLPVPDSSLDRYHPGDQIEAQGTVVMQFGMTMVAPDRITVLGRTAPPQPLDLSTLELQTPVHLGQLVRTRGTVQVRPGYNTGGVMILLPGSPEPYRLFIPRGPGATIGTLDTIRKGDTVRVSGIALQYSPTTPYNVGYELLVADIGDVVLIERPPAIATDDRHRYYCDLLVGFFLWTRSNAVCGRNAAAGGCLQSWRGRFSALRRLRRF
jgi:hypothetical protein